jgi:hypothetical protein
VPHTRIPAIAETAPTAFGSSSCERLAAVARCLLPSMKLRPAAGPGFSALRAESCYHEKLMTLSNLASGCELGSDSSFKIAQDA